MRTAKREREVSSAWLKRERSQLTLVVVEDAEEQSVVPKLLDRPLEHLPQLRRLVALACLGVSIQQLDVAHERLLMLRRSLRSTALEAEEVALVYLDGGSETLTEVFE